MSWTTTRQTTKSGATKHTCDHSGAFGRRDPHCARCQELAAGAAPRTLAWAESARRKAEQEANRSRWIRQHNCQRSGCGPVCTFGDW